MKRTSCMKLAYKLLAANERCYNGAAMSSLRASSLPTPSSLCCIVVPFHCIITCHRSQRPVEKLKDESRYISAP